MSACAGPAGGAHGGTWPGADNGYMEMQGMGTAHLCATGTLTCSHAVPEGGSRTLQLGER